MQVPDPGLFERWWPQHGATVWRVLFTGVVFIAVGGMVYFGFLGFDFLKNRFLLAPTAKPVTIAPNFAVPPPIPVEKPNTQFVREPRSASKALKSATSQNERSQEERIVSAEEEQLLCDPYNRDRDADKCDPYNRDGYRYRREHQVKPAENCNVSSTGQQGGITACTVGVVNQ